MVTGLIQRESGVGGLDAWGRESGLALKCYYNMEDLDQDLWGITQIGKIIKKTMTLLEVENYKEVPGGTMRRQVLQELEGLRPIIDSIYKRLLKSD